MGKQWKKDGKIANAAKKGAVFTKLSKEITVAARMGGADAGMNNRLRLAIEAAKKASMPKDTIERAIARGAGNGDDANIEELVYEGFGPHQVGIIVEAQTDNRNRTAPEMKTLFRKHDGALGESGSVAWMFKRVSRLEATFMGATSFDPEEEAIEVGADSVQSIEGKQFSFLGAPEDLATIQKNLMARHWDIQVAELSYEATQQTQVTAEQREEVIKLLEALDDHDDTHRIHTSLPDDSI